MSEGSGSLEVDGEYEYSNQELDDLAAFHIDIDPPTYAALEEVDLDS